METNRTKKVWTFGAVAALALGGALISLSGGPGKTSVKGHAGAREQLAQSQQEKGNKTWGRSSICSVVRVNYLAGCRS